MKDIPIAPDDTIELWKTTQSDGTDFYTGRVNYNTEDIVVCPDWDPTWKGECGHALHLADSPNAARYFLNHEQLKTARLFKVSVHIEDCICFPGLPNYPMKIRVKKCRRIKEYPINYNQD